MVSSGPSPLHSQGQSNINPVAFLDPEADVVEARPLGARLTEATGAASPIGHVTAPHHPAGPNEAALDSL
jgi:hypothetical protein